MASKVVPILPSSHSILPLIFLFFVSNFPNILISSHSTLPPLPILPLPSASQLAWQQGELALFLHFGPNTFTDSEWGTGAADPSIFNPDSLDARQWVAAAAASGFARVVITAKHHDGFCLWPSAYTDYSVAASPWRGGSGDVVGELAAAAKEAGIGLGLYLSPWDRHEPLYGDTRRYNEYYLGQMRELLTNYGDIAEVWLDGAKGEGEKDMEYFFDCWFKLIHQLQPRAVIFSDAGPDSRWIGDEAGIAGSTCWSLFNQSTATIGQTDFEYSSEGDPYGQDWVPPECDVSIRPGWFWHKEEHPKSAITLLDLYYKSVGRNCFFLLNVPPNSSGLISDEDLQVLQEFNNLKRKIFSVNLAQNSTIEASSTRGGNAESKFCASNVLKEGLSTYWAPDERQTDWEVYVDLGKIKSFNVLQIQEPIQMGQRVVRFHLDVVLDAEWKTVVHGTTIGFKRLLRFPIVKARLLRFTVDKSRAEPLISYLGIYLDNYSLNYNSTSYRTRSSNPTRNFRFSRYHSAASVNIGTS